ncbi:TolC family protein [Ferruginibacter albus]|uniref:TolC family protein n=1 Tax=Ferruginibacter albus TaxID=2875540 RepID=UPI001CC64288|nr:TolC family protein [Ferruginibacter albus]UAY52323.1 TolC family protein [Ferruginibacter albus]
MKAFFATLFSLSMSFMFITIITFAKVMNTLNNEITSFNNYLTQRIIALRPHFLFIPMRKVFFVFTITLSVLTQKSLAQADTTTISVADAEKIFLQKNLFLLAAKYNIDANKALIRQAKLWDNPVLNTDQNIYDGKFFRHDADNGQVYVQLQELIRTAGKRNKAAQLATDNTKISEAQFDDLVRTLRYALRSDLHETHHLLRIKAVYDAEIAEVQKLSAGMDELLKAGNISVKENMRIKALLFGLQNELVNVESQLLPIQAEIKLLLQNTDGKFIKPSFDYQLPDIIKASIPDNDSLMKLALANRTDIKIAQSQLDFQNHNLIYQKALAKADVTVGTEFDQRNSYAPNYFGLAISLPINIFNRNQGNIKSAQASILQQKAVSDQTQFKAQNDVTTAADKLRYFQSINNLQQLSFSDQYDALFQNMLKSYQQRQLSLLEFIDFIDAYKDTKLKLVDQHNSLLKAAEDLNYAVGTDLIKDN